MIWCQLRLESLSISRSASMAARSASTTLATPYEIPLLYLSGGRCGHRSNPAAPVEVAYLDNLGRTRHVSISGDFAYVAENRAGLRIVDISDPTQPKDVGYYDTGEFAVHVFTVDRLAYVSDFEDGVYILRNEATTGIESERLSTLPKSLKLEQNYPNPFNPITNITYQLPTNGKVRLTIYSLSGEEIRTLVNVDQPAGTYQVTWDGCNQSGRPVSSGMYFYRLETQDDARIRKMLLLR